MSEKKIIFVDAIGMGRDNNMMSVDDLPDSIERYTKIAEENGFKKPYNIFCPKFYIGVNGEIFGDLILKSICGNMIKNKQEVHWGWLNENNSS